MKQPPVLERIRRMTGYQPGEQPREGELLKLNTNENPYPPSPKVAEAVERATRDGLERYPQPLADPLREAAALRYGVSADEVLAGNGSDELLSICMRAAVAPGDGVSYAVPTYSLYRTLAELAGARVREIPADPGTVPAELAAGGSKVIFVCSPNSPFGCPVAPEDVDQLAATTNALVVADEAYVDFGGRTALPLIAKHENLVVLRTFSKSFSLAGVRLGLAFGSRGLIAELAKVKDSYNVSRLAVAAGVAALEDYSWMTNNCARVIATRDRTVARLRDLGLTVPPSAANFFWVDCSSIGGGRRVYEALRGEGLLVRFFDAEGLRDGVRVSVGTDDAMDRLLAVIETLCESARTSG